jgi:hypothetical protein
VTRTLNTATAVPEIIAIVTKQVRDKSEELLYKQNAH